MAFKDKVRSHEFAVLAEFQPPKGADFSDLLTKANLVRGRVTAFLVPDQAMAVMKASSLGACAFLQQHGLESILEVTTRDRNRLALQADILSAAALGTPNIMAVSGDNIEYGDHHLAREVKDLSLNDLLEGLGGLMKGKDMAGNPVSPAPGFFVGSAMNVGGDDGQLNSSFRRLDERIERGVEFIVTTPIFDLRRFEEIYKRMQSVNVAVIPTVMLLKSGGMAKYVSRNVHYISVPGDVFKRFVKAPDPGRVGLKLAAELMARFKEMGCAGALILARGWEDKLPQILNMAGL